METEYKLKVKNNKPIIETEDEKALRKLKEEKQRLLEEKRQKRLESKTRARQKSRGTFEQINSAFARFPMFMIKTVAILEKNRGIMTLESFLEELGVQKEWFKDVCEKSKIFNSYTLDEIGVFECFSVENPKNTIEMIKLCNKSAWGQVYKVACSKVIKA